MRPLQPQSGHWVSARANGPMDSHDPNGPTPMAHLVVPRPSDVICPLDCIDGPWPATVITDSEIHQKLYDPLPQLGIREGMWGPVGKGVVEVQP